MSRLQLAFFYCFGFISIGCILSQLIPLLNEYYSSLEKSLVLGFGALIAFFMSILFGKISDSIKKIKPSIYINIMIYLLSIFIIFFVRSKLLKGIGFILVISSSRMVMSTIETLVFTQKRKTFAKYHCMGAIGLIIGSLSSSYLTDLQKVLLCVFSGFICIVLVLPIHEIKREEKEIQLKDIYSLLKNHSYLRVLSLFFFLMMMGFADQYVVVDKMISLNASSFLISLKYALQASMEIPLYLLVNRIMGQFNQLSILVFCIFMSALKLILYAVVNSSFLIIFVSLLQIVTHPLIVILSKKMIERCTPSKLIASSQMIGFAFYFGISGFLVSLISQWLNSQFSYNVTLYVFSFISIFPFIIWCFMKKYDKVK